MQRNKTSRTARIDKDVTDIAGLENDLRVNSKHRQQPTDQNVDRTAVSLARKKERKKEENKQLTSAHPFGANQPVYFSGFLF